MISRRVPLWQKAVAFAPVLLLLASLPGQVLLRCRMDGLLRSACCCPERQAPASPIPALKAQDCCDRQVVVAKRTPADAARSSTPDIAAVALAMVVSSETPSPSTADRQTPVVRSHAPPRDGPSVILLKQSFLI